MTGGRSAALLAGVRRRLRVSWASATLQLVAPIVAAAALALVLAGRWRPWRWAEPAALVLPVAVVVAVVVAARTMRVPPLVVARAADRGLGTHDAFGALVEFGRSGPDDVFGEMIVSRADHLAAAATASAAVPLRWNPRRIGVAVMVAALAVGLAVVANPQDARRAARERDRAALAELAAQLQTEAEEVAAGGELDAAAAQRLERLVEELRRTDSMEEAAELARSAAAELGAGVRPDLLAQKAAAQGLEQHLALDPLTGDGPSSAADQLAAAAAVLDGAPAGELDALAERLGELAAAQRAGDPATAEALAAAAAALRDGDVAAAKAALGEAAAAHASTAASVRTQQAAADAAAAARRAADRAQAAAEGDGQSPANGNGQGNGQGQGSGQGQGGGNGQGQGSGQGQGGGGGSPSGQVGGGGGSAQTPAPGRGGQGSGAGHSDGPDGQAPDRATVAVPMPATGLGESGAVGGGDGDTETVGRTDGPTGAGTRTVPLAEVLPTYVDQATAALDATPLAPSVRDLVRDYFDALQGRSGN